MNKQTIRQLVKSRLKANPTLTDQSARLVSLAKSLPEWKSARVVAMYLPMKDEPNIDRLILEAQAQASTELFWTNF